MLNPEEILFVVDKNNQPDIAQNRRSVHKQRLWHRTTNIWITNSKKQILCQKRSEQKDTNPGLWEACFGGHVLADEDYRTNAWNELQEEIGLKVEPTDLVQIAIFKNEEYQEFQGNFWLLWDGEIETITFEKDEIQEVKWMTLDMVIQQIQDEHSKHWSHVGNENEVFAWIQSKYT